MFILMPVIFVLGILAIALEDKIKINKAAIALFMAISMWMILMFDAYNIFVERSSTIFQEFLTQNPEMASLPPHEQFINFISNRAIVYHLGNVSETLFFVMCSMLIVDIVDKHGGFRAVTGYIRTPNKRKLLWYISFATFFFSALLASPCSSSLNTRKVDPFLNNQKWAIVNGTNILTKAGINT